MVASYGVLIPAIINWSKQNPNKEVADFPLSIFFGSSSFSVAPAPAHATAPAPTPAPAPAPASAPAPAHSSPSSVSGVLGKATSLDELDALTI